MIRTALLLFSLVSTLHAGVTLDIEAFGKSLGGWNAKSKHACDYDLSGSGYRTYKPEITPTPDGGILTRAEVSLGPVEPAVTISPSRRSSAAMN